MNKKYIKRELINLYKELIIYQKKKRDKNDWRKGIIKEIIRKMINKFIKILRYLEKIQRKMKLINVKSQDNDSWKHLLQNQWWEINRDKRDTNT